jgi:hypothetical protein
MCSGPFCDPAHVFKRSLPRSNGAGKAEDRSHSDTSAPFGTSPRGLRDKYMFLHVVRELWKSTV